MKTYTVQPGDTLSKIAEEQLGEMELWPYLASINQIASPYTIYPGEVINIGVAEVEAKKKKSAWPWIGLIALAGAGVYWRKDIWNFLNKKL